MNRTTIFRGLGKSAREGKQDAYAAAVCIQFNSLSFIYFSCTFFFRETANSNF